MAKKEIRSNTHKVVLNNKEEEMKNQVLELTPQNSVAELFRDWLYKEHAKIKGGIQ